MYMPFLALGEKMLFLICQNAPALSAAIWMCSFVKEAAIPASSALFNVCFGAYPSRI
jgi:hypothetical protein